MATEYLDRITNRIPNPSAEVNATGWAGASATVATSTAFTWAGLSSFLMTATAAVTSMALNTPALVADANRVVATAGENASVRAVVMTPQASRQAWLVVEWRNASSGLISTTTGPTVALAAGVLSILKLEGMVVPALTTFATVYVRVGAVAGNLTIGNTAYVDAIHYSPTEVCPTYVDGSFGAYHHWTGTAHLSSSYRDAIPIKQTKARQGLTRVSAELWLSDYSGKLLSDITPFAMVGKVSVNLNNSIKGYLTLSIIDEDAINPYADIVSPVLKLTDIEGNVTRYQQGVYVTLPGKASHHQAASRGDLEGRDLCWVLANSYYGGVKNIPGGTNVVAFITAELAALGLRYNIPASSEVTPKDDSRKITESKLDIWNKLLGGIGYYSMYASMNGILVSRPYFELATAEPALQLFTGPGGNVIDTVEEDGVYETVANQVIVYKENTSGAPIVATRTNNDPASPASIPSRNGRIVPRLIADSNITSQVAANAIAKRAIETGTSYTKKLKLTTKALPGRDFHEVYDLAVYNAQGKPLGFGLWWCDGWELGFSTSGIKMTHNLNRLEPFGVDATP